MNKLVIFGVGLIGGSVALALKRSDPALHIVGVGRTGDNLQAALDLGVIDQIESSPAIALKKADMVIIAVPVAQTANILSAIAPHLEAQTIITDVGSTKSDVLAHAQNLLGDKAARFVPGHPIAGAEKSGVTAAKVDLYDGKNVVLTPAENTSELALQAVTKLWQATGANVSQMTAQQHDGIFAAVSHLPHLLAFALVDDLAGRANAKQLFDFAASGFRDFTRIAGSSPEMWRDISLANRTALLTELAAYQDELARMQSLLENNDGVGLQALFEQASQARNKWAHDREKLQK
ncbi:MAG TPA: prephenate dehydrogenase/arogenate dehydrogenase family protein [Methylophilaceae bacterium]|nr:prephenate dehydrogenase/arogenate dehydrogenase family protein [Methylophilaceae bacterium]